MQSMHCILNHKNWNDCLVWRASVMSSVWTVLKSLSKQGKTQALAQWHCLASNICHTVEVLVIQLDWLGKKRHKIGPCFFFSLLDHVSLFISIIEFLIFTSTPCRAVFVSRLEAKRKLLVRLKPLEQSQHKEHSTSVECCYRKSKKTQVKLLY